MMSEFVNIRAPLLLTRWWSSGIPT